MFYDRYDAYTSMMYVMSMMPLNYATLCQIFTEVSDILNCEIIQGRSAIDHLSTSDIITEKVN